MFFPDKMWHISTNLLIGDRYFWLILLRFNFLDLKMGIWHENDVFIWIWGFDMKKINFFFIWKYTSLDIAFWISIFVRAKLLSKQVRYRKNPLFPRCSSLFIHICIYVCVCKNWWWMMQISLLNTERLLSAKRQFIHNAIIVR